MNAATTEILYNMRTERDTHLATAARHEGVAAELRAKREELMKQLEELDRDISDRDRWAQREEGKGQKLERAIAALID